MSVRGWIFKKFIKSGIGHSLNYGKARQELESFGQKFQVPENVVAAKTEIDGVKVEWAYRKGMSRDMVVIFMHGGGFCTGSVNLYRSFSAGFADRSQLAVLSVEYRLAPENPFPAALEDLKTVYRKLLKEGTRGIVFMGDSAGANLCLAVTMALRDSGEPLPGALALISPWVDLTMTSDSIKKNALIDPVNSIEFDAMCARDYAGEADLKNSLISPIYGDFRGLPPMFIHAGTDDMYMDDSVKLSEKAQAAGVRVNFELWKGMFHDFTIFYKYMPESKKSFNDLISFVRENLS